ncbi:flagellar motor protein MotB [Acetobacter sp.]|uniref:flagellar motor protein MotB n=1 Tax=Acetobacter sp. TaxID=440 RepID=UPI0039ECA029
MSRKNGDNKPRIIVIRRGGGGEEGHHGGAWKIAYADFVTAMMAFFLVMWLINATTEQRRRGIANFFNPMATHGVAAAQALSEPGTSGSPARGEKEQESQPKMEGMLDRPVALVKQKDPSMISPGVGPGAGGSPGKSGGFGPDIATMAGRHTAGAGDDTLRKGLLSTPQEAFPERSMGRVVMVPPRMARIVPIGGENSGNTASLGDGGDAVRQEEAALQKDAQQLKNAIAHDPEAQDLSSQVSVGVVPEGLRIQLSESDRVSMFETGSAQLNARATHLLKLLAPYLISMPQNLSIYGYTDGALYKRKGASNWTLSSARADAARAVLSEEGFPEQRLLEVSGRGSRDLAVPDDPGAAANRRVVLVLHRDHEVKLPDSPDGQAASADTQMPAGNRGSQSDVANKSANRP